MRGPTELQQLRVGHREDRRRNRNVFRREVHHTHLNVFYGTRLVLDGTLGRHSEVTADLSAHPRHQFHAVGLLKQDWCRLRCFPSSAIDLVQFSRSAARCRVRWLAAWTCQPRFVDFHRRRGVAGTLTRMKQLLLQKNGRLRRWTLGLNWQTKFYGRRSTVRGRGSASRLRAFVKHCRKWLFMLHGRFWRRVLSLDWHEKFTGRRLLLGSRTSPTRPWTFIDERYRRCIGMCTQWSYWFSLMTDGKYRILPGTPCRVLRSRLFRGRNV